MQCYLCHMIRRAGDSDEHVERIDRIAEAGSISTSKYLLIAYNIVIFMIPIKLEGVEDENFRLPGVVGEFGEDVRAMIQINARLRWC